MTLQQAFELALQHHQSGRLAEAEALYRQILAVEPRHADALHLLGVISHQVGRNDVAVDLIRQAIALAPDVPDFHSNLGEACRAAGHLDPAIAAYRRAIALQPDFPEAHYNLGNTLKDKGQVGEAIEAYHQAIALKPSYAEAWLNLGNLKKDKGQLDEAIAAFRRAVALKPTYPDAYSNLGNALREKGQLDEAIAALHQAIGLKPDLPEARCNLGIVLLDREELDDAIAAFRRAIALSPSFPEGYYNLGIALSKKGRLDEAIAAYRRAVALKPDDPEAHGNLGNALKAKGQMDEAIGTYRQAIALKPSYAEAHNNLGNALKDIGRLDDAIRSYRQAIALRPSYAEAHSNVLYSLHFHSGCDTPLIRSEHRRWNQQHAEPLRQFHKVHLNDCDPERRLRIGYVSPDFCNHVVGRNVLPVLERHDHSRFEVFCYANVFQPDTLTQRFQAASDVWRNIAGVRDQAVVDLIRTDRIDILIDLTLHMANHRLMAFARRPAPVQVTWAGYPGTTGLDTMDYRLSDPHLDPPGASGECDSEATIRLPHSFWCFDPLDASPEVSPLPALTAEHVTFGCLNNYCKVHEGVIELWSRVLRAVRHSRLLLLCHQGAHRLRTLEAFERHGVAAERIEWFTPAARPLYLAAYRRIDLGLDTFPYNGHTTSLDSFWMGVPVVTLVGETIVGRAGLSQLMNLKLPELVAHTPAEFVQIATELAHDLPRLTHLRSTLRERMEQSPLMDAPRFARDIEAAYRELWRKWCANETGTTRKGAVDD